MLTAAAPAPAVPWTEARPAGGRAAALWLLLHFVLMGAVILAAAAAIAFRLYEDARHHQPLAVGTGLIGAALLAHARLVLRQPWMSPAIAYLALFWLFHFGLTFTAAIVPDVLTSSSLLQSPANWHNDVGWLYWPNVRLSMLLGVIGAAAFLCGVGLTLHTGAPEAQSASPTRDPVLYGVGWLVLLAASAALFAVLAFGGGLGILTLSYADAGATLFDRAFHTAVDMSHLGCLAALCGAGRRGWRLPLALWFVAVAVPMLLIGLRNEALFPLIAFAVVLTYRQVRLPRAVLAGGLVFLLLAVPAIRATRQVGFSNRAQVQWGDVSPLHTLTEMGGTLRAVKAYVDAIEGGDEYLMGASYWAPFDRQVVVRLMPARERIPYENDQRTPGRLLPYIEGAVGTAATGEAYYNFGVAGPFVFFTAVGLWLGWVERRARTSRYSCALLGISLILLCFNIRGEWLQVPAQAAVGMSLLAFCLVFSRLAGARSAPM